MYSPQHNHLNRVQVQRLQIQYLMVIPIIPVPLYQYTQTIHMSDLGLTDLIDVKSALRQI